MENLFFYSSKIAWTLLSPDSVFAILLLTCLLLLLFNRVAQAKFLLLLLTIGILLLSFFPIGEWMLYPLESRFRHNPDLTERVDGIIVLGGSVLPETSKAWQQLETNGFHERLSSFIELAKIYPDAKLVFSGGNASLIKHKPTEAEIVHEYLVKSGLLPDRLLLDSRARNTAENITLSKQLAKPISGEGWILITTAFHMPRAVGLFCHQDWVVTPYPVDHKTIPDKLYRIKYSLVENARYFVMASHEWLGLLAYYLTGKIASPFPNQCG